LSSQKFKFFAPNAVAKDEGWSAKKMQPNVSAKALKKSVSSKK